MHVDKNKPLMYSNSLFMVFVFYKIARDDLKDIRKKLEKEEEHVQTGPLKTKSELSLKVC